MEDLLNYHEKLFNQTINPKLRPGILAKCLENAKSIHLRMLLPLKPAELSKHKEFLH